MTVTSMNVSLPDGLKNYVKERVAAGDDRTPSDFARDLIRGHMHRRRRQKLEQMLLDGMASGGPEDVTPDYLAKQRGDAEETSATVAPFGLCAANLLLNLPSCECRQIHCS
jgi:antitoxin ParD1/3/4